MSKFKRFNREEIKFKSVNERVSKLLITSIAEKAYNEMSPLGREQYFKIADLSIKIRKAREKNKPVVLCMGAHPIKNGCCLLIKDLIKNGWVTHVAVNGAAAIHDWEFARFGKSTECVRTNVAIGEFGIWKETGEFFGNTAANASQQKSGWGELIGSWMADGIGGPYKWNKYSVILSCHNKKIPFTIHPGIGQDIIYSHPSVSNINSCIVDFEIFAESIKNLESGVYISAGSSVMSPMIFEKALSMSRNVEIQNKRNIKNFFIAVNDLADNNWNWDQGEPPMSNPAYYLRWMKTFSRMGGQLEYYAMNNIDFFRHLQICLC